LRLESVPLHRILALCEIAQHVQPLQAFKLPLDPRAFSDDILPASCLLKHERECPFLPVTRQRHLPEVVANGVFGSIRIDLALIAVAALIVGRIAVVPEPGA